MAKGLFDRMKESIQGREPGKDIAWETLTTLYRAGFVILESNGQRLILSPSGRFDTGQRQAAMRIGDMLSPVLPEAGNDCPQCGGRGFVIGADLRRSCIACHDLPKAVEQNAQGIGGLLMKGEQ